MRLGILFHNKHNLPFHQAVLVAKQRFDHANHTCGHPAIELRLNPDELAELPQELQELRVIDGLVILADGRIKPKHLRITTADLGNGKGS